MCGFSAQSAEKPHTDDHQVPCCRRQICFKHESLWNSYHIESTRPRLDCVYNSYIAAEQGTKTCSRSTTWHQPPAGTIGQATNPTCRPSTPPMASFTVLPVM